MNRFRRLAVCSRDGFLLLLSGSLLAASTTDAQEQVDKADLKKVGSVVVERMTVRVRAIQTTPEQKSVRISWHRGGAGLTREKDNGEFVAEDRKPDVAIGAWSAWLPLEKVVGRVRGWTFANIVVSPPPAGKKKAAGTLNAVIVEFEFAENGKVFKTIREAAPRGATVTFAFPGGALTTRGAGDPEFVAQLQGLAGYVRARRGRLEKLFPEPAPLPKQFGILGHLGGYGEGPGTGKGKASGYGVRHCNPEIVADECRTQRLLGVNGFVGEHSVGLADRAGVGKEFRRVHWGGPGAGSPMNFFKKNANEGAGGCPFDPVLKKYMAERAQSAIAEYRDVKAQESWALWWDEMGVAAKEHIATCPRCRDEFRAYLRAQGVQPAALGKTSWDEVTPYPLWQSASATGKGKAKGKGGNAMAPAPTAGPEALRYYYTFRFMTHATGQLFPEAARKFQEAGVRLYAMQGPTPSWTGASLDWHELYDLHANTAMVWETSNRDPRVWQWESYLGDIARGIGARHRIPIGSLIKPHRGAPEQRMLTIVARGGQVIEWYTYGPDYAKGDSFSQRPDLLERVARSARFLGQAEDYLYGARWAGKAEVAFVSPRSSEIWGKATDLGATAFEDAKWVYLALTHAHIPVDILSEQQLAEGKLSAYKAIYVAGPNLRRDAAARLLDWVRAGGTLWTDALGLSRDEANRPALAEELGLGERKLESWGSVDGYRAVGLTPLKETSVPPHATLSWNAGGALGQGTVRASIGREPLAVKDGEVVARFADGKAAVVRRKVGKGEVVLAGLWAGLTYSARVRRADFDMAADFDPALRALIAAPAIDRGAYRPVVPAQALVESIMLEKDGRRSVALINWSYRHGDEAGRRPRDLQIAENLRIKLPGVGDVKSVRSLRHGKLTLEGQGASRSVVVPKLEEIDLLILE